jgi:PhnB protein
MCIPTATTTLIPSFQAAGRPLARQFRATISGSGSFVKRMLRRLGCVQVETFIAPWLSVHDASRAVDFYVAAFGAVERYRLEDGGRVVVAQLAIANADFWVQEDPPINPANAERRIRMILTVADPDAVFSQALAAGGVQVSPVAEGHGWRIGRLADPFGHHWEVGKRLSGDS